MKILKFFGAGFVALFILCLLCLFYYDLPLHQENVLENTDYIWEPNKRWFKLTEGFSGGRFDNNGFNNIETITNPDILVMGSSHTIATEVMQDENFSYLLNNRLKNYKVYNIGMNNHSLFQNSSKLEKNLDLFPSTKILIMETSSLSFNKDVVDNVINDSFKKLDSFDNGIISKLQKLPYLRLIYKQYTLGILNTFGIGNPKKEDKVSKNVIIYEDAFERLFKFYSNIEDKYKINIIIFYHPNEILLDDGNIKFDTNQLEVDAFYKYSEKYGISFINMEDAFIKMYYNEHHVPHGFSTGEIGTGHLNKYGHKAIADELYRTIIKMEGEYATN